jgi:sulfur-oxidizing protein SoxY
MSGTSFIRFVMMAAIAVTAYAPMPALADDGPWESIRDEVYQGRTLKDATGIIDFKAPYRPENVMAVPLSAEVSLKDGKTIKSVTFVVDKNPSPIAAKFNLGGDRSDASIATRIRLNEGSDVHLVVETNDGELFVAERHIKFAGGQASCSAPPAGDPAEIAANMGKMTLAQLSPPANASMVKQRVAYELNHPNHTGMVLDQITLLYVQLQMVDKIEARQGDDLVFSMEGSITMAQNPYVEFDFLTNGSEKMTFTAHDTKGNDWTHTFPIGAGS